MSFEGSHGSAGSLGGTASKPNQAAASRFDALKDDVTNVLDRGRTGVVDSANTAGDNLSSDVAKLRADMASIQQTMSKFVSQAGGEAVKTAQGVGSAVASQIGDVANEMASATREQAKTFASEVEKMARANPLATVGATLLVGVIIGMMSRGRA
jgi:ElaB/YqjD/DUF883 family membrane-anchored ribosome-binding protein